MVNTYTQLYIQLVFSVKFRRSLITEVIREPVQKYLTGIAQKSSHKLLAIYCMPDHAHVLIGMHPAESISQLANNIKSKSSAWINNEKLCPFQFNWQDGFGAFSYDKRSMYNVIDYIRNQPQHHKKQTFKEEYLAMLIDYDIEFKDQYLFDFFD